MLNGVFSLNGEFDVASMVGFLDGVVQRREHVVIYGATTQAYAAIHGCLEAGVAPEQITLLLPLSRELDFTCFNEFVIDEMVRREAIRNRRGDSHVLFDVTSPSV